MDMGRCTLKKKMVVSNLRAKRQLVSDAIFVELFDKYAGNCESPLALYEAEAPIGQTRTL
jgi:hypothetical protein